MLTAWGMWPAAYSSGVRTSRTTALDSLESLSNSSGLTFLKPSGAAGFLCCSPFALDLSSAARAKSGRAGGAGATRYRGRKPFVVAGYAVSALSKPVMGLAAYALGWPLFLIGRCSDRLGKSIRTSARDALIADSTEPAYRGVAFGLHRAM